MNARRNSSVKTSSVKPQVETLEDRCVPTTAFLEKGILHIKGTDYAETIKVTQSDSDINVVGVGRISSTYVRAIHVDAMGGNDSIDLRDVRIGATVYGASGDDFIVGTSANDYLNGGSGNDRIFGMDGNDSLYGSDGNDRLFGMNGYDCLLGESGNDFLDDGNRYAQEYANGGEGMNFNADIVAIGGTTMTDIHQRGAPTCGFLSTLAGLANNGTDFTQWIRYADFTGEGMPQYEVAFWQGSGWTWTRVNFDGVLNDKDTAPSANGESWVVLMQRAWIKFRGDDGRTWPHEAIMAVNGQQASAKHSVDYFFDYYRIAGALEKGQLVIAGTNSSPQAKLIDKHAYNVTAVWGSGTNVWVQVRNPWGRDGGSQTYGDANDGYVWLTWSEFAGSMNYLSIS